MAIQTQMNLGRVRPVYKGAYNALAAYGTLDMVLYEKEIWMMVARSYTPGDLPVDAGNGLSASGAWAKIGYQGERGLQGETGPIGPYYRPSVAVDGTFSWTNDGGLVNPDPVKIDLYWHTISGTAARVSTTQFTVAGTESVIVEGRGVRINDAILTHIKSVSVANDVTTVTVDTAVVPATISKVEVGVLNTDMLPVTSDASKNSPLWVPNSQALAAVKAIADAAVPMSMTSSTGGAGKIPIATNDGYLKAGTPGITDNSAIVATTAFVNNRLPYTSGTFTPVFKGDSTAGTFTYSSQEGKYWKIGRLVYIYITLNGKCTSQPIGNYCGITGLPFNAAYVPNCGVSTSDYCGGGTSGCFSRICWGYIAKSDNFGGTAVLPKVIHSTNNTFDYAKISASDTSGYNLSIAVNESFHMRFTGIYLASS